MLNPNFIVSQFLLGKYPEQIADENNEPIKSVRRELTKRGFDPYEHLVAAIQSDSEHMKVKDVTNKYRIGTNTYWEIMSRDKVTGEEEYAKTIPDNDTPTMAVERKKEIRKVVYYGVQYLDVTDLYLGG